MMYPFNIYFWVIVMLLSLAGCRQRSEVMDAFWNCPEYFRGSVQPGHATLDAPHAPKNETKLRK